MLATAKLLRERGSAISVQDVMGAAGLSHGGFYKHFASKDELLAIAATQAYESVRAGQAGLAGDADGREKLIDEYLSAGHRDAPGDGCVNAALATEVAHAAADAPIRAAFAEGLEQTLEFMAGLESEAGRDRAVVDLATLVGAISLARAVSGTELSEEILETVRQALTARRKP